MASSLDLLVLHTGEGPGWQGCWAGYAGYMCHIPSIS